ncbi:titin-like isoform X2 [Vanessa cardui]|uniref:titin-like isoform X2 n=1 Tax=Vanessa cardui TaxID=171605 RepID=UPI001F147A5E|nr:titin-like isoform X2 [Vanessa cardui]
MGSNCCKGDAAGKPLVRSSSSIYNRSRAGAKLDDRFSKSDDAGGVRLTITAARTGDSGVYTLQASNAAGKDSTRVRLEVSPDEMPTGDDPPTFLRRLQDLTVKVGTRTRFLVEIVSSTECRVTWYRNERRLLEAERIALVRDGNFWCADISAVSVDDAGRWTCTAENVGGRASCSAHLNVLVPKAYKRPEFVEELRALLTEQGTVSLECKVVGVPTPVLRWFKDSREIKAGDVFALTANAEDPTSLGTYTCEAVNCMGRAYSSSKVHVVGRASREGSSRPSSGGITPEPPPIFTKELEDHFIRICEPLTLSCNIVVPPWPRNVVWYNKEGKIDPSERYRVLEDGVGGYLLEVPTAEWPDEGEWKCVVTSSGGRVGISTCYVSMDVPKNYRKPRFMENLQAVLTEEGLVSFECKVVGFPTPVLSWFKDGQELKPGDVYQLTGTNSLGSYCCIARNCMGQASSSAELTVEDIQNQLNEDEKLQLFSKNQAPKFLQGLKSIEAKIDEPFRFTIKVAIPPEPTVSWYRDDQPVDESLRCHHGKEERGVFFLDIQNLEFMDQAEWKCVAMNNFGQSVTSCFLKLIIPRHYKKPRFLENLQAILSDEGAVNLECKVIGVPQPVLKWYKDGEELKPGDIHRIISGQDGTCCLGTYTCEAQNCMGIAASSASLLGFEDSMKAKSKKKADEQALQRNLSLSTIHEERTSQMYDTPVGDITLDEKGEISFSFDGKEVSVSLYETPDLTEEEALQIVEMYADQLSENVTEHNVVELPPLRFVKETSTSGNLLMEAIIIDVSPEYFTSPEEDLRTEADIEDISIADENGPPQLSLDQEAEGEDYLEKTIALLSDEIADFPKKVIRKKSDSQRSADDYFSLSRDQSLSEEKKDDDTQMLSESDLQSYASARSSGKPKSKSSKPSIEDGQESSDITKTVLLKEDLQNKATETEVPTPTPKKQRRRSRSSRRSSSGSEKSFTKIKDTEMKTEPESPSTNLDVNKETIKTVMNDTSLSLTEVMNEIQLLERDIILKSEFMSTAATASNSLEIINSLITPLSEIHSITDAIRETVSESSENITPLLNTLPQSLKNLQDSLTIISKCIDVESDNKTLVKKTCMSIIRNCGNQLHNIIRNLNDTICNESLFVEKMQMSNIETITTDLINIIHHNIDILRSEDNKKLEKGGNVQEATLESKHLHATQKAIHELKGSLRSLLYIIDEVDNCSETNYVNIKKSEIILNDMSTPIQDLQTALEQIEILSVTESNSDLQKYNTEIIEKAMESVLKLRTSFEQLSGEECTMENKDGLNEVLNEIKINIRQISIQLEELETKTGKFDILSSDNKLETLQKIAQILINLENNLPILESAPSIKGHMTEFHKNLTKVLENVIESNDANKYFTLLEICDAVNRMNTSIKSIETNNVLSMASIGNTLKIIHTNVSNNVFEQGLNLSMLENISNLLVCIQENINKAEELRISENLEEVKDLSLEKYEESKVNVVLENIEQTIVAISNVISHESSTTKDFSLKKAMENICPILVDLKYCIASSNVKSNEKYEKISEIESVSLSQSIANPLIDLQQNISVLNQVICENADSQSFSLLVEDYAKPLLDLRNTLEILQHDVISQCLDNEQNPELNTSIANVVESLKSCIVMIQEQNAIEAADDMSTLEDISGIKTTADVLPSDEFTMVTINKMENVQFAEETIPSGSGQALQILKESINKLQDSELLQFIESIDIPESSIRSINIVLEEVGAQIESILHPITIESCQELSRFSQLVEIIQPLQEVKQHLSVIDIDNIPVYENKADSTPEKISIIKENILFFNDNLNNCLDILQPAIEITDTAINISTKINTIRQICDEINRSLDKLEGNMITNKGISAVNHKLQETVNLFVKTINSSNNTEQVKHAIENLYEAIILIKDELTHYVNNNPESISIENTLIQHISDMENDIISLEHYNFVNLSQLHCLKKKVIELKEPDYSEEFAKEDNVNKKLAELITPLDLIYKKMLLVSKQEKEAQEIVVFDLTPIEIQLINENIQNIEQRLNLENISINKDDISMVIKLNDIVNSILNYMKNTQISENFKPIMLPIETLGKILHRILSAEKVEDKRRSLKEKAETLLQHMEHYIEIIEIVEEVSAVIKIEDLKESANIVRELQQSIVTQDPSSEVTIESSSNKKIKEEQAEIAQRLHKALMMFQTQALESTQDLTATANEDIRQQIIEVISDLQNDFMALTGTNVIIEESLTPASLEKIPEKKEEYSQDAQMTQAILEAVQRNLSDESETTAGPEMIQKKTEEYSQDAQTAQVIHESEQQNIMEESETVAGPEIIHEISEVCPKDVKTDQVILEAEQRNLLDESETTASPEIIPEKIEEYSQDAQTAQVILESEQLNILEESETIARSEIIQEKPELCPQDKKTTQDILEAEQRSLLDESETTASPEIILEKLGEYSQDEQTAQVIIESEQQHLLVGSETIAAAEIIQEKSEVCPQDAQTTQVILEAEQRNLMDESEITAVPEIISEKIGEYSQDAQTAQVIIESEERHLLDGSETIAAPEIIQEKSEVCPQDAQATQVIPEAEQRNVLDESEITAVPEIISEKIGEYSQDAQTAQVIIEPEERHLLDGSETIAAPEIIQGKSEVCPQDAQATQVILEAEQRNLLDESEITAGPKMMPEKIEESSQDAQTAQVILESEQLKILEESEAVASPEIIQEKSEVCPQDVQATQVILEAEQRNLLDESEITADPEVIPAKIEEYSHDAQTAQVILEAEQRNILDESEITAVPEIIQDKMEVCSQDGQTIQVICESEQQNLLDESENTKETERMSRTEQPIEHLESNDQYQGDHKNVESSLIKESELKKPSSKFESLATIKDILLENIKDYISDETMLVLSKLSHPLHCEHLKKTIEIATQLWNKTVSESSSPEHAELSSFTTEQIELVLSLNEAILIMYETTIEESQELELKVGRDELNVFKDVVNNLRQTLQEIISNMNTLTYFAQDDELQPEETNKDLVENIQSIPSVSHTTPRLNEIEKINEPKYNVTDTSSIEVVGSLENNNNILKSGDKSDVKITISATDLHTAKKEDIICKTTADTRGKESDGEIEQKPVNKETLIEHLSNYISDDIVNVIDKLSPALNLESVKQSIQTAQHLYNILSLDQSDNVNFTTEQLKFALLLDNAVSSISEFANQETEEHNELLEICESKKADNVIKELQNNLHSLIESTLIQSNVEVMDMDDFKVSITKDPLNYTLLIGDSFSDAKSSKESMEDNKESIMFTKEIEIDVPTQIETTDELITQGISAAINIETVEDTTLISEKNVEVTSPNLKEELQLKEGDIDSIVKLDKLLKEVNDMIDLSCDDNIESIQNSLDEVQTIIMELKSDFGGTVGDVNETLEDLECNVRSVQLQINEHSPPVLLKEACANLQVLVAHLSEINDVEKVLRPHTYEITNDILDVCSNDVEQTIDIIESVSCSAKEEKLENVISNLNKIKDTIKSLRSNFLTDAETLIMGGIDITQILDQIEERIFCLEKDLESEKDVDVITRDSILSAIHSIYGSISNMRGTVSNVQKKYLYENYGEPSRYFLLSIKNVLVLLKNDENSKWKGFAKTLRKVLNHFEDVKFYINFDKTARLPSDAAFTKIILAELHSVLSQIVLQKANNLDEELTKHTCDIIDYVNKILKDIEQNTTLEVKEKIPIFKELSNHMFELTENFKHFIENDIKSNRNNVVDQNTDLTSLTESTTVQEENIPDKVTENDNSQIASNIELVDTESTDLLSKSEDKVIKEISEIAERTEERESLIEENIESDKLIQEIDKSNNLKDQIESLNIQNETLKLESEEETKEVIKSVDIVSAQEHSDDTKVNESEQLTITNEPEDTNDEKKDETSILTNKSATEVDQKTEESEHECNQEINKKEQLQIENVEDIEKISQTSEIVEDVANQGQSPDNIAMIDNSRKEDVAITESKTDNIENKAKTEEKELEVIQCNLLDVMQEGEISKSIDTKDENNKLDDAPLFIKDSMAENEERMETATNKIEEVVNSNVVNKEIQENINITSDKPKTENLSDKNNDGLAVDINLKGSEDVTKEKEVLVDEQLSENKTSIIEQDNAVSVSLKEEVVKDDIKLENTLVKENSDTDQLKGNSIIEKKLLEEEKSKTDHRKDTENAGSTELPTVEKPQSVLEHDDNSTPEEVFQEKTLQELYEDQKETRIQAKKICPENDENKENLTIHENIIKEHDSNKNDDTMKEITDTADGEKDIQTDVLIEESLVKKPQEEEFELRQNVEDKQGLSNVEGVIENKNPIDITLSTNLEEQKQLVKEGLKTDRIDKDDEIDKIEAKNVKTKGDVDVENVENITKLIVGQGDEEASMIKTEEKQENKKKEEKIEKGLETETKNLSLIEETTKDFQTPKTEQISIDKDLKDTEEKIEEIKENIKIETITSLEDIDQVTSPLNISLEIKENLDIKIVDESVNENLKNIVSINENIVQIAPTKDEKIIELGHEVDSNASCNDEIRDEKLEIESQGKKNLVNIESTSDVLSITNIRDGLTNKNEANCELSSETIPESKENVYLKLQVDNQGSDLNDKSRQVLQVQHTVDNEQESTIDASKEVDIPKKLDDVSQLQDTVTEVQEVLLNVTENQIEIGLVSKPDTPMVEHVETEIEGLNETEDQIVQHIKENLEQEKGDVSKIESHAKKELLKEDEKSNDSIEVESEINKIETSENEKDTKLTEQQSTKHDKENFDTNEESAKNKSKKDKSPEIKSNEKESLKHDEENFDANKESVKRKPKKEKSTEIKSNEKELPKHDEQSFDTNEESAENKSKKEKSPEIKSNEKESPKHDEENFDTNKESVKRKPKKEKSPEIKSNEKELPKHDEENFDTNEESAENKSKKEKTPEIQSNEKESPKHDEENFDTNKESVKRKPKKEKSPEIKSNEKELPKHDEQSFDTNEESAENKSKKEKSPEIKSNEKDIASKEKETGERISNQLQEETSIEKSELSIEKPTETKDQTQGETVTTEEQSKNEKKKKSSNKLSTEKRRSKKSRETQKPTAADNEVKPQEVESKEMDQRQEIIDKPDEGTKLKVISPEDTKNKVDKNEELEKKTEDYEVNKTIQNGTKAKDIKVEKTKPEKMIDQEKKDDEILTAEKTKIKDDSQVQNISEQNDKGIVSKLDNKSIFEEKENKAKNDSEIINTQSKKIENKIVPDNKNECIEKSLPATTRVVKDDRQEVEDKKVYPGLKEFSLTDYESEFSRPPGYIAKPFSIEDTASQLDINTKGQTIYKAQTLLRESQLRSSVPPHMEQNLNNERQSQIKDRTKALSECRSTISEKRTTSGRDNRRKPVFSTFLTDRTAVEGSRVKLTCSILSPSDPTITWYKNGKELDNKHKFRSKFVEGLITLEILNAIPSDSGEYSCTIKNENGSITSSANLKVYPSFEASPIPPTFTRSIRDNYHLAENELVLECRIRGQPLPTITWLKDDKPIALSDRYQAHYLADGVCRLTISSPNAEDSGKYTCKAENSMWSDQISHDVYFTGRKSSLSPNLATVEKVQMSRHAVESRRPHFTNVLSDHKVVSGGTIGLQVEIRGSPIRVEWLREGHSITELYRNAQTYVDHGIYTLALSDVTEQESGLYTCRAYSTQGNVDMNASITVVQPNQYDGKPASIVSRPERDVLISVGEDLNISFRVHGEPKAKVFFMKGIRDITNSQRVCKMTSDDYVKFTLKRTVVSDAGTYCIFARNAYGCDRAFVTVVIRQRASSDSLISDWTYPMDDLAISSLDRNYKSVPDRIPSEPSAVDGGNNWITLAWPKPDQQSRAPILAYKVESWLLGKEGGARWVELGITPRNTFDAFNLKQGEEYHFRVSPRNRYGWGESVQTSVPIGIGLAGDRPEFVDILPGQLKVLVGETATLSCSFKGKPIPEIVWMKNGHEIEEEVGRVSIEINDYNSSLRIEEVKSEDEGRYSCEATNIHGRSSTYSRMAVITDRQIWQADAKLKRERSAGVEGEYPPQFTMRLRDRRVQATYPVRLTCQVVGNPPPTVKWFKNEEEVVFDGRHTASQDEYFYTLEIAPTTLEDGGVYEAMARNGCGAVSCRCSLVVDKGIRAYIAPEFCCGLEPLYHLSEGDELRISAIVEAYPSVGVTWYRDGVRLRPSRRAIMTLDRDGQIELAVASVTGRDAGVYTCTASNEVGTASTSGKVEIVSGEHEIEKTTMPPIVVTSDAPYSKEPMFIRKPRSSEAREGDTVIIECEVIGDPKPDVYWLRDFLKPDYYRDSSHFKRVGAGPAYRFEIPHAKLDYTGAYSIVAKNIHGEAKAIISLQILAKDPTSGDDVHNIRYGRVDVIPRFDKELTDLLCYDGDAIEFECSVSGNPEPDIRWLHYNEIVLDCVDFESSYEEGTARLKIKQVTAEDEGTYTCEASNSLGKASSSACLVVYPPGEPNTLSQRLRRPPALLSAASTPRSTPRTTPARSLSRTPGPDPRRFCSPSREIAPKFYTYPFNRVAEEGDTIVFQCAVKGLPPPWATWDKDGIIITPSARISIKEKDEMLRILEIEQVTIEDVGLYRISLENEYGRAEASARLEVITQKGKFYGSTRSYSVSPRKTLPYRRRTPSFSKQD